MPRSVFVRQSSRLPSRPRRTGLKGEACRSLGYRQDTVRFGGVNVATQCRSRQRMPARNNYRRHRPRSQPRSELDRARWIRSLRPRVPPPDVVTSDPPDIGLLTRRALRRLSQGMPAEEAAEAVWRERGPEVSAGNGSVMYCAPLRVAYANRPDEPLELAPRLSSLTHFDQRRRNRPSEDGPDQGFCLFAAAVGLKPSGPRGGSRIDRWRLLAGRGYVHEPGGSGGIGRSGGGPVPASHDLARSSGRPGRTGGRSRGSGRAGLDAREPA